jgi:hypothetical protein
MTDPKSTYATFAEAFADEDQVRFRIRVRGVRGSLENLVRSADESTRQTFQDGRLWDEAVAMLDDLRDEVVKPK